MRGRQLNLAYINLVTSVRRRSSFLLKPDHEFPAIISPLNIFHSLITLLQKKNFAISNLTLSSTLARFGIYPCTDSDFITGPMTLPVFAGEIFGFPWSIYASLPLCGPGSNYYAPAAGGGAFWNCAIRLFVCPVAQLPIGYRHAGCPQLSHRQPPEMWGLRTHPRTGVDPPRFLNRDAIGGGISSRLCFDRLGVLSLLYNLQRIYRLNVGSSFLTFFQKSWRKRGPL